MLADGLQARRTAGSAEAAGGFLARREPRWRPATGAARGTERLFTPVPAKARRCCNWLIAVAISLAL